MSNAKSYVNKTNSFFYQEVYPRYWNLAEFPVGWALKNEGKYGFNATRLFFGVLLAPALIPATFVTSAIALCLAVVTALVHCLSIIGTAIADKALQTAEKAVMLF
ncbi:MAG: hypothetical protein WC785_06895 [Tatlockia sp.]|jgi:hypothetical protein